MKELTYLNTEHLGTGESDRRTVFDVYCENEYGEKFLMEMQRGEQQFFKDRVFTKLFDAAEIAKFDKAEYEAYEESLKALRDWKNVLETAEKKAREEGRIEKALEMALRLKSAGVPIDVIARCSGLSEEEINQLEE
ncbi:MAG: Rpn family recombination-promoting nuclease/putative transposase [Candidatus Bacteroides intestinipullorum]|uniref:Rpn family recombination-promoting nuclease/putative transposase n=1 Tax=Candidatus Bacteroides intestinipullorum TaxID=2838471 RepID=A0A9E2KFS7_9BACE|nr:Rpn family recombination-promoting nuclease/putative transposase [Candidatus Bacteroides intestinipullorum]